jgi:hypothetical protein
MGVFPSGEDREHLLSRGVREPVVETDEGQGFRAFIAENECRSELESIGSAEHVSAKQSDCPATHSFKRRNLLPALEEKLEL